MRTFAAPQIVVMQRHSIFCFFRWSRRQGFYKEVNIFFYIFARYEKPYYQA
jgi:hypothetical protein